MTRRTFLSNLALGVAALPLAINRQSDPPQEDDMVAEYTGEISEIKWDGIEPTCPAIWIDRYTLEILKKPRMVIDPIAGPVQSWWRFKYVPLV